MAKVTLDKNSFKALASETRLDILRTLDGKKMGIKDISNATNLNKATLHEHLTKLHEAGLVKRKEREGHKWVYYKLSWKGASLFEYDHRWHGAPPNKYQYEEALSDLKEGLQRWKN